MLNYICEIRPVLDYVCDVCYIGKEDYEMEKVHLGYLKYLLHVKRSSGTVECGRFPLMIKNQIQALKYWQQLLESDDTTTTLHYMNHSPMGK